MEMVLCDIAPDGRVLLGVVTSSIGMRGCGPGSDQERELSWLDASLPVDLSGDGRSVLFLESGIADGPYSVYLRGIDGSPATRIGNDRPLALSPDGRWVLAMRYTRPQRLVLLPTGPGETAVVKAGGIEEYACASWLPGGRDIVFQGNVHGEKARLFVQRVPDGEPRPITPPGVDAHPVITHVVVSPDGQRVAALSPQGRLTLYPVSGGTPEDICALDYGEWLSQWSADGKSLFVSHLGSPLEVSRLDLASGRQASWKKLGPPDRAGAFSEALLVTPDGGSYVYSYSRTLATLFVVDGLK